MKTACHRASHLTRWQSQPCRLQEKLNLEQANGNPRNGPRNRALTGAAQIPADAVPVENAAAAGTCPQTTPRDFDHSFSPPQAAGSATRLKRPNDLFIVLNSLFIIFNLLLEIRKGLNVTAHRIRNLRHALDDRCRQ